MAIRAGKSGELVLTYGKSNDETDVGKEWNTKRRKLGTFCAAIAIVTTVFVLGPHMPGWAFVSRAVESVVAAIW